MTKYEVKEKVRQLRKKGLSYNEIRQSYTIAKSTISLWCRDIILTKEQINRLGKKYDTQYKGARAHAEKRRKEIIELRDSATAQIPNNISKSEFFIAGLMLYWAEGDKVGHVGITNSDPNLIHCSMKWFRQVLKVPEAKFRVSIYYHLGQDELELKKYWSTITQIPLSQFHKSIFKNEGTGQRKNILYYGTCKIRICDENLRHKILAWIEKVSENMGL